MKQKRGKKEYGKEQPFHKVKEPAVAYTIKNHDTMLSRSAVIDSVKNLPNNFTIDELIDRLLFIQSVEKGLKDSKEGKVYSEAEAKRRLKKWLK